MKIAVAIATEDALPTAFVVFRGIEESIRKAAEMGYDGIELALMDKDQVSPERVERLIREHGLEIPVVSTGQVFAGHKLWFTDPDAARRRRAVEIFKGLVDVAARFRAMVNMGRVRGFIAEGETTEVAEGRFAEAVREIAAYARPKGVDLILEPVNRYEINFINSVDEGAALMERLAIPGLKLMPDVFHMNIEDASIEGNLQEVHRPHRLRPLRRQQPPGPRLGPPRLRLDRGRAERGRLRGLDVRGDSAQAGPGLRRPAGDPAFAEVHPEGG